jgi:hypothetical protein
MLAVDHVIWAVRDLDEAAAELEGRYGLGSVVGGRHAGHGTANRIVPLGGDAYLEVMAVVDPGEAAGSPLGTRVLDRVGSFFGWCVRADDVTAEGARLGRILMAMDRTNAEGARVAWRIAGLEDAVEDASLPFFITWDMDRSLHPARSRVAHRVEPAGVARVTVASDPAALAERLGRGHGLPVEVVAGEPHGVVSVTVRTAGGELTVVPV